MLPEERKKREEVEEAFLDLSSSQDEVGVLRLKAVLASEAREVLQKSLDDCQLELERLKVENRELCKRQDNDSRSYKWMTKRFEGAF